MDFETNQMIMDQIDRWHEAGEHEKIIEMLESMMQTPDMTEELLLALARAYIYEQHGENDMAHYNKLYDVLMRMEESYRDTFVWNFYMGTYYALSRCEGRAIAFLERALDIENEDERALEMLQACQTALFFPVLPGFSLHVQECWKKFQDNEVFLRELVDGAGDEAMCVASARDCFDGLFARHLYAVTKTENKYELHFHLGLGYGRPMAFLMEYVVQAMPDVLQPFWDIKVGIGAYPMNDEVLCVNEHEISLDNIWVHPYVEQGNVYLDFAILDAVSEEVEFILQYMLPMLLLGEVRALSLKHRGAWRLLREKDDRYIPFKEALLKVEALLGKEAWQAMGTLFGANDKKVITHFSYNDSVEQERQWEPREDITWQETVFPELTGKDFYLREEIFNVYRYTGVMACYLVLNPASRTVSSEEVKKKIYEVFQPFIDNQWIRPIAYSSGYYYYFDFLVWNHRQFLEALEACMKQDTFFRTVTLSMAHESARMIEVKSDGMLDMEGMPAMISTYLH